VFRQDRTNPSSAVSNWKGRKDTAKAWPSTAVSSWLNGGLFGGGGSPYGGFMQKSYNYANMTMFMFALQTYQVITTAITTLGSNVCYGICNNQVAGYSVSGINKDDDPTYRSRRSWKVALPSNVSSEVGATVTQTEHQSGFGYANSGTAGYYGSGITNAGAYTTSIEKFAFSSDTSTSTISPTVNVARYMVRGMAKSGDRGLSAGGWGGVSAPGTVVTSVIFSSDSGSTQTSLSTGTYGGAAMSNGQVAGYFGAGYNLGSAIDKWDYASSFTHSTLSATLNHSGYSAGYSDTGNHGYWSNSGQTSATSLLAYASETTATATVALADSGNWSSDSATMCFSSTDASP